MGSVHRKLCFPKVTIDNDIFSLYTLENSLSSEIIAALEARLCFYFQIRSFDGTMILLFHILNTDNFIKTPTIAQSSKKCFRKTNEKMYDVIKISSDMCPVVKLLFRVLLPDKNCEYCHISSSASSIQPPVTSSSLLNCSIKKKVSPTSTNANLENHGICDACKWSIDHSATVLWYNISDCHEILNVLLKHTDFFPKSIRNILETSFPGFSISFLKKLTMKV